MNLNRELVLTRCQEIEDSLRRLEQMKAMTKEAFLGDKDAQDIASYRLLVAIEAALGLCYHVAAKHLKKVPGEYAECFVLLADAKIIPADLSGKLQRMARFRNLLVHLYWKVDYGTLYDAIRRDLEDLRRFAGVMAALV